MWMNIASAATFTAGNPVALDGARNLIWGNSDTTQFFGIALNDAGDSLPGIGAGKALVAIPEPETVFSTICETGEVASALSVGQTYGLERSGNYMRINPDSQATTHVVIVGRQDGQTIDSADSSVFVRFLGASLGLLSSAASVTNW